MAYFFFEGEEKHPHIVARVFSANVETYKKIYIKVVKEAFKQDNIEVDENDIQLEVVDLSEEGRKTIQKQRHVTTPHNRSISILLNGKLKYIVGITNTNYDEDKLLESKRLKKVYRSYGGSSYHANTYFYQGINRVFDYYFEMKKQDEDVKLFFYLLDVHRGYPSSLYNLLTYRRLATIGFSILNIDEVSFDAYKELDFYYQKGGDIKYTSFNKLVNDMTYISKKNSANVPSYLKCINENTDEEIEAEGNIKYVYMYKGLAAEAYESAFAMWTLNKLAKEEGKNLEFNFLSELYNFKNEDEIKETKDTLNTMYELLSTANVDIKYETEEEAKQDEEIEKKRIQNDKVRDKLRNQELLKNNMRKKGILTKCSLCGCEIESILEAAHLWGVSCIEHEKDERIEEIVKLEEMKDILEEVPNKEKEDIFYKKYALANSGDNAIWLCRNHHKLFDNNYYYFDPNSGEIIYKGSLDINTIEYIDNITFKRKIEEDILTEKTKVFLSEREKVFKAQPVYHGKQTSKKCEKKELFVAEK